jgi:hypothetical protein
MCILPGARIKALAFSSLPDIMRIILIIIRTPGYGERVPAYRKEGYAGIRKLYSGFFLSFSSGNHKTGKARKLNTDYPLLPGPPFPAAFSPPARFRASQPYFYSRACR